MCNDRLTEAQKLCAALERLAGEYVEGEGRAVAVPWPQFRECMKLAANEVQRLNQKSPHRGQSEAQPRDSEYWRKRLEAARLAGPSDVLRRCAGNDPPREGDEVPVDKLHEGHARLTMNPSKVDNSRA